MADISARQQLIEVQAQRLRLQQQEHDLLVRMLQSIGLTPTFLSSVGDGSWSITIQLAAAAHGNPARNHYGAENSPMIPSETSSANNGKVEADALKESVQERVEDIRETPTQSAVLPFVISSIPEIEQGDEEPQSDPSDEKEVATPTPRNKENIVTSDIPAERSTPVDGNIEQSEGGALSKPDTTAENAPTLELSFVPEPNTEAPNNDTNLFTEALPQARIEASDTSKSTVERGEGLVRRVATSIEALRSMATDGTLRVKHKGPPLPNPLRQRSTDVTARAIRMARTFASDIIAYRPDDHRSAVATGLESIQQQFAVDISKARTRFEEQVSLGDVPTRDQVFRNAINELLGKGQPVI